MATLYFAFANDPDHPLDQLKKEYEEIKALFEPLDQKGYLSLKMEPFATLDTISEQLSLYRKDLLLFHYGGHADQEGLFLDSEQAKAKGIASLLGQCPLLRLVFINGCSSIGQLDLIQQAGVPSVILTSAAVGDLKALHFAVRLYRQLSFRETLNHAYESARGKILMMDDELQIARAGRKSPATSSLWGLYHLEGREDMNDWRLPLNLASKACSNHQPNEFLLEVLQDAITPYSKPLSKIKTQSKMGIKSPGKKIRKEILRALPHPLSEHLRKLLSAEGGELQATFYNQPGMARLTQMVHLYRTTVKLFCFVLLAQLWDIYHKKPAKTMSTEEKEQLKSLFRLNYQDSKQFNFFLLFRRLYDLFEKYDYPFFIKEFSSLKGALQESGGLHHACSFMEAQFLQLQQEAIAEEQAIEMSELTEQMLAQIMADFAFLGRYTLTSIKNISLIKYRHLEQPVFSHSIVKLVQEFVGLDEEQVIWSNYLDNTSVLLIEKSMDEGLPVNFINLSPFIIDLNAFDEKASLAKLYFLDRFIKEQYAFAYRHIYMPDDNPLIVNEKIDYYNILEGQFDFFAQLLFDQPLKQAV